MLTINDRFDLSLGLDDTVDTLVDVHSVFDIGLIHHQPTCSGTMLPLGIPVNIMYSL